MNEVVVDLEKLKVQPVVLGNGSYVVNQYPLQGTVVLEGSKVFLLTNGTEFKMPNVVGWSTNEMIRFCNLMGISYHLNGYGVVESTNVEPDSIIQFDTVLEIQLNVK